MSTPIPGATGDPLPTPPVTEGAWGTIGAGHQLIYVGSDALLDWVPATGKYRVLNVNRLATGGADPLAGPVRCEGTWAKITSDHRLVFLGDNRLLDWLPADQRFKVWRIDHAAEGNADPLPDPPLTQGQWVVGPVVIEPGRQLIAIDGDRVMDWSPTTADFRVWEQDHLAAGTTSPLVAPARWQGNWGSTLFNHRLLAVGQQRVLDWAPVPGDVLVRRFDATAAGNPFQGHPETTCKWASIGPTHELVYLDGNRVLDWEPNGHFRMWRYLRNVTTLRLRTVKVHLKIIVPPLSSDATVDKQMSRAKALYASYGFDIVEASREDLRASVPDLSKFETILVGDCRESEGPTADVTALFHAFRKNVKPNEVVIYFVRDLLPKVTACSTHPPDMPGSMIAHRDSTELTLAHELGHVLGIIGHPHLSRDWLMSAGHTWSYTNPPPDLHPDDTAIFLASPVAQP